MLVGMWSNQNVHVLLVEYKLLLLFWQTVWYYVVKVKVFIPHAINAISTSIMFTHVHKKIQKRHTITHVRRLLIAL